jgi:hypothetical protein
VDPAEELPEVDAPLPPLVLEPPTLEPLEPLAPPTLLPDAPPALPLVPPALAPELPPALPPAPPAPPPDCAYAVIANRAAAVAVTKSFNFMCSCSCEWWDKEGLRGWRRKAYAISGERYLRTSRRLSCPSPSR